MPIFITLFVIAGRKRGRPSPCPIILSKGKESRPKEEDTENILTSTIPSSECRAKGKGGGDLVDPAVSKIENSPRKKRREEKEKDRHLIFTCCLPTESYSNRKKRGKEQPFTLLHKESTKGKKKK